jgi:hypothetical protein
MERFRKRSSSHSVCHKVYFLGWRYRPCLIKYLNMKHMCGRLVSIISSSLIYQIEIWMALIIVNTCRYIFVDKSKYELNARTVFTRCSYIEYTCSSLIVTVDVIIWWRRVSRLYRRESFHIVFAGLLIRNKNIL